MLKDGFLSFARKYEKRLLDTGLDVSKKVVHKTCEFIGNECIYSAVEDLRYANQFKQ